MGTRMLGCQIGHDVYSPVTRQKWHSIKHLKEELFETLRGVFVLPNKIKMDLKTLSSHDIRESMRATPGLVKRPGADLQCLSCCCPSLQTRYFCPASFSFHLAMFWISMCKSSGTNHETRVLMSPLTPGLALISSGLLKLTSPSGGSNSYSSVNNSTQLRTVLRRNETRVRTRTFCSGLDCC